MPKDLAESVWIRTCEVRSERQPADELVRDSYLDAGYDGHGCDPAQNRWLQSSDRDVVVALEGSEVVGTVSIIRDGAAGLPSDAFRSHWMDEFREKGEGLGEVSALAVRKDRRRVGNLALYLMRYFLQYSFYVVGLDRLVLCCRPSHGEFYAEVLRFEKLGGVEHYPYAGVPAQFLSMDLLELHRILWAYYERGGDQGRNLYRFLMCDEHLQLQFSKQEESSRSRGFDWAVYARERGEGRDAS